MSGFAFKRDSSEGYRHECCSVRLVDFRFLRLVCNRRDSVDMSRYLHPERVLYESVDGFLLLLCLVQVSISPIFFVIEVVFQSNEIYYGPAGGALRMIDFVLLCLDGVVIFIGVVAGILLWLKKRSGVHLALIQLGARDVLAVGFAATLCLFNEVANGVPWYWTLQFLWWQVAMVVLWSSVWIFYLLTSRRVKYMYFERHDPDEWE